MLFRRIAAAIALLVAVLASQLPEFTQQYRQRLGGAIDELEAIVTRFDAEAADQTVTRDQGIARLKANPDPLAQGRGADLNETIARAEKLKRQRDAFRTSGPLSEYAVLAEDLDAGLAKRALMDFRPAVPITVDGLLAAATGFILAWLLMHGAARIVRRPRRVTAIERPLHYPR